MNQGLLTAALTSLPGRYARALFEVVEGSEERNLTLKDFEQIEIFFHDHPQAQQVLMSHAVNKKYLDNAWQLIGRKIRLTPKFLNFMRLLVQERRVDLWSSIYSFYQMLVFQQKNYRRLDVVSAYSLSEKEKKIIKNQLERIFPESLDLTFAIDESILSGIVIKSDTLMLDASFVTQLKRLAGSLRRNV